MGRYLHDLIDDNSIWNTFFKSLKKKIINARRFLNYKNHVKYFLSKAQNTPIDELSSLRVITYLNALNKSNYLEDWQINQAVDAIRLFLRDMLEKKAHTEEQTL